MTAVPQVGSKLARSACGTKRKVRAAPCASAGAARRGDKASAAPPAADVRNLRRFMISYVPGRVSEMQLTHARNAAPWANRPRSRAGTRPRVGRLCRMEALLKCLPARPQPIAVRYGASAALVLVAFAFRLG